MKMIGLKEIISKMVMESSVMESEAADQAKSLGLTYLNFGRWGKMIGGKMTTTHVSQSGKLVPAEKLSRMPPTSRSTPDPKRTAAQQRERNKPHDPGSAEHESDARNLSPSGQRIVSKIHNRLGSLPTNDNPLGKLLDKYDYQEEIPATEFEKTTGIFPKAAKWYSDNYSSYEKMFSYNSDNDTITLWDPADV